MIESGDSSVELAQAFLGGDDASATTLFSRYRGRSVQFAERRMSFRLRRRIDPEDVYQSVCLTLLNGLRRGQFRLHERGDLWKLVKALTDRRIRKQVEFHSAQRRDMEREVRCPGGNLTSGVSAAEGPVQRDHLEQVITAEEVQHLLNQFRNPLHRLILCRGLEGATTAEIADEVRLSQARVRQILQDLAERLPRTE